jgi:hypothetical protein
MFAVRMTLSETVATMKLEIFEQGPQIDMQGTTSGLLVLWQVVMNILASLHHQLSSPTAHTSYSNVH